MTDPIRVGAFDPFFPNGIVTVANKTNIFGLRILTYDPETKKLSYGNSLDFKSIKIEKIVGDRLFQIKWQVNHKWAGLTWGRIGDREIYAKAECDENLQLIAELYVPWEYRLKQEWVNFTRQNETIFTGELITPYPQAPCNAIWTAVSPAPSSCCGYNQRAAQLDHFCRCGNMDSVAPPNIWSDLGVSWFYGMHIASGTEFNIRLGNAAEFLEETDCSRAREAVSAGAARFAQNRELCRNQLLHGTGPLLEPVTDAICAAMQFNALYREDTGRRYIITDRPWDRGQDDWGILFNWDTFLSSWAASWVDPELAKENLLSGFDVQLPDGKIPLHTRMRVGHQPEPPILAGRAQHIVQSLTLWHTYLHCGDKVWLKICYEKAKRANAWWFADNGEGQAHRDALGKGLLGFGYDAKLEMGILGQRVQPYIAQAQYAYFETYDDSPQWTTGKYFKSTEGLQDLKESDVDDEAKYVAGYHMANMYTLERSCLYAVDCECLMKIAQVLGNQADEQQYRDRYKTICQRINELMWDEADGCYYNLKFDGTLSKIQSPDCFMPLMTGCVPEERKKRLLTLLLDEHKFWGGFVIPSIAKDHPAFPDQKYWRGQIWPPQVLWTYLALKRCGEDRLAWEFARKAAGMLAREWTENGFYPENFSGITGRCSGSPHYNWGTLMGMVLLEELVDARADRIVFGNPYAPDGTALENIRLDGKNYTLKRENGKNLLYCDGVLLETSPEKITVAR